MKRFVMSKRPTASAAARTVLSSGLSSSSSSATPATCLLFRSPGASGSDNVQIASRSYAGSFTRKKEKKKAGAGEDGEVAEGKRFDEELWKLRPQWVTLTRTTEQLAEEEALVKSYAKLKMKQLHEESAFLAKALKMKLAALNELPPDLRAAALVVEVSNAPRERVIPLWTAPVPNYQDTLPPEKRDEPFDFTKLGSIRKRSS